MRFLTFFFVALLCFTANAQTLEALQEQGHVDLKVWLEITDGQALNDNIATKQQVILVIDVGTDNWFSGGTKIGRLDVKNLLVMQRNKLATNYSERKLGVSWARQRWEITLYPLSSGKYVIPPTSVTVNVVSPTREKVSGTLITPPLNFSANLPSAKLTNDTPWLSATNVNITQHWSLEEAKPMNVGDAIVREIIIEADNTTSALIPEILSTQQFASASSNIGRYYQAPVELLDTQPRGAYAAKRSEKLTFIAQQSGEYQAPAIDVLWWNSQTNSLESVTIAGRTYHISHTPLSWLKAHAATIAISLALLAGVVILFKQLLIYYRTHPVPAVFSFLQSIFQQRPNRTRLLIYRRLSHKTNQVLLTEHLNDNSQNTSLIHQWQQPFSAAKATSTIAFIKIWQRIKKQSIKRSLFPPALPELEKYKTQRDVNEQN